MELFFLRRETNFKEVAKPYRFTHNHSSKFQYLVTTIVMALMKVINHKLPTHKLCLHEEYKSRPHQHYMTLVSN
jgi:hypothetical protein